MLALVFLLVGVDLPEQQAGPISARLHLAIPEQGAGPSRARALVEISVTGPATLMVDGVQLEDALAAWRMVAASSTEQSDTSRVTITLTLGQRKPGMVDLPGIRIRAREGPDTDWVEFSWPDLLRDIRDPPDIERPPELPKSPWPFRTGVAALLLVLALAAFWLLRARLRKSAIEPGPVSHLEQARAALASARSADDLAGALRHYLEDSLSIPAARLTSQELAVQVASLAKSVQTRTDDVSLPDSEKPKTLSLQHSLSERVRSLLSTCDQARFSGKELDRERMDQLRQEMGCLIEELAQAGENREFEKDG